MRMKLLSLMLLLSSCNEGEVSEVEEQRGWAIHACGVRAFEVQGLARLTADGDMEETGKLPSPSDPKEPKRDPEFRFVDSGQFVVDLGPIEFAPDVIQSIRCTGDFNAGRFMTVQVNGRIYRPKPGETWGFIQKTSSQKEPAANNEE